MIDELDHCQLHQLAYPCPACEARAAATRLLRTAPGVVDLLSDEHSRRTELEHAYVSGLLHGITVTLALVFIAFIASGGWWL